MDEEKEVKDIFNKLNNKNQEIVKIIAKGMQIAQDNERKTINERINTTN